MREILINDNDLENIDLDYKVTRVKGIVINSNDELILIKNNNTYQLPGGHVEKDEELNATLARELREELGVSIDVNTPPFLMITTYDNDYLGNGDYVSNRIYYYVVKTDIRPDPNNLILDALEKNSEFKIYKVKLNNIKEFLNRSVKNGTIESNIARELEFVFDEYMELYGGA